MKKIEYETNDGLFIFTRCEKFEDIKVGSRLCKLCAYNNETNAIKQYVLCNAFKKKDINYWVNAIERDIYESDKIICHLDRIKRLLKKEL